MAVEMAVTGTVLRVRHWTGKGLFGAPAPHSDILLFCETDCADYVYNQRFDDLKHTPIGILGARVRMTAPEGLRQLHSIKAGDFIYAQGDWHAPGFHDLEADLLFRDAARDWYRLERWDAGEEDAIEIRAVELSAHDVRRYDFRDATWKKLTANWAKWEDPLLQEAGWEAHRRAVGKHFLRHMAMHQKAVAALEADAEIGRERQDEREEQEYLERKAAAKAKAPLQRRKAQRTEPEILADPAVVEERKQAAQQLAARGRAGKGKKRKKRKKR